MLFSKIPYSIFGYYGKKHSYSTEFDHLNIIVISWYAYIDYCLWIMYMIYCDFEAFFLKHGHICLRQSFTLLFSRSEESF